MEILQGETPEQEWPSALHLLDLPAAPGPQSAMTAQRRFEHSNNPAFACAEAVLLLPFGRESYLPAIVEALRGEPVPMDSTTDRIVYRLRGASGPLTLLYTGMGAPAAANGLEMVAANGARRVVVFGACGGVVPEVAIGDLIVAEDAVRGEGTSRYYASPDKPARCDHAMTEKLWSAASSAGTTGCHRGRVYTTDAGYRQGPEIYDGRHGRVLGVECECSAAAIVAADLELALGTLLFVTDNVTLPGEEDRVYRALEDPRVRAGFESGLSAAVQALAAGDC